MVKKVKVEIQEPSQKPKSLLDLFYKPNKIYQARVRGKFRLTKWVIMYPLLALYYGLPWLRWDRGEGVPDQAVMWDTAGRKLYFFFIEIWPQEVYIFTGLLLLAALSLFFFTTLFGRVWCGYTCPQTVWTDLFFIIERRIEGDRHRRKRLDAEPWSFRKIRLKVTKHFLWILISVCTGGAWVFYFTDVPTFWSDLSHGDISTTSAFWIALLTCSTYVLAGFAREQVCTFMCPYARFQGAMFDKNTLIVSYDEKRGEPRGKKGGSEGDCIDCGRCVAVCPTGIDIRNGQQYQCINCALCIDACNEVMEKVNQPLGLIRYNSENNRISENLSLVGASTKLKLIRPRTLIYAGLIIAVMSILTFSMTRGRTLVEMNVLHSRNPLFIKLSNGDIRNVYTLRFVNKQHKDIDLKLSLDGLENAKLHIPRISHELSTTMLLPVNAGSVATFKVFVEKSGALAEHGRHNVTFKITSDSFNDTYETYFMGPKQ
tara:strand:- start:279012 stop:280466 length:1455 start_codon:yes stop_codon:yes gene_type:complete